jgi:hypothetical protein
MYAFGAFDWVALEGTDPIVKEVPDTFQASSI